MRFDEWEFRKYNLKNARHKTPGLRAKISLPCGPASETELHHITLGNNDVEPSQKSKPQGTLRLTSSCHHTAIESTVFDVDNVLSHGELIPDSDDGGMMCIGELRVPRQPVSLKELFSYIPHNSGLQIYGLLGSWKDGAAWIDGLSRILRDKRSQSMILEPRQNVQIGKDFIAHNYFEAVSHCIPSLRCQVEVKRSILLAIQEQDVLMPQSPPWVIAWWKANNTCEWSVALYMLRQSQAMSNMKDFFTCTGQVMVGKRLLYHHYDILANDVECSHLECVYRKVDTKKLMREYVEIIQDITGIVSQEEKLDTKFYVFALELLSDKEESVSQEVRMLRLQAKESQIKTNKFRQVIAKYTNVNAKEVDDKLDHLLAAEMSE